MVRPSPQIARLLIEHVSLVVDKAVEHVDVEPHCIGGHVESHVLARSVRRYDSAPTTPY
ncbi:hypothetical protein [Paludisphaera borealis]|uniref:hypothetical protein n=1 Tax=Paludisphaera borealis TaxID=1387353 RepID=UPI00143CCFA8|nr:hypothetical protein [Paludisphaera borealis]